MISSIRWRTTLILIRHGQARSRDGSYDANTPLSGLGRLRAEAVAEALVGETTSAAIYTSPYPRALETSEPLCRRLGLEPVVDPRLAEFDLEAGSFEAVEQRPDLVIWHPEHRGVAYGETLGEFSGRVADFCDEVAERHRNGRVPIFAHSGTIDAVLRWSLGFEASSPWQHEFDLGNASITEIETWPHGRVQRGAPRYAVLPRIGDVTHLEGLASEL